MKEFLNFCTLFDSNYMTRGLAMYTSLQKHMPNSILHVFAFDEKTYFALNELRLPNLKVISLSEFEDEKLIAVKKTRSKAEYCWTCTPSIILYCIKKFDLESCTYVDADLYFFSSPKPLLDELTEAYSISLTKHDYSPEYDQSSTSGIYCVQFMTFKNNKDGLSALTWWQDRCIEWCYDKFEDGKFGDQKYLDDWPERFKGVRVLENQGSGIAPWNIQKHEKPVKGLIFYHFHGFKNFPLVKQISYYPVPGWARNSVYYPYIEDLKKISAFLKSKSLHIPSYDKCSTSSQIKLFLKKAIGKAT